MSSQHSLFRLLALIILSLSPLPVAAEDEPFFLDLPIIIWYCDVDPGQLDVGGGRGIDPEEHMRSLGCTPAEGVELTLSTPDQSWFERCALDDHGRCTIYAPSDPDVRLSLALHPTTVEDGRVPSRNDLSIWHVGEFTGFGFALVPDTATVGPQRTLAFHITRNGEPDVALTQLAMEGEPRADAPWLATNDEGWVSSYVPSYAHALDFVVHDRSVPEFSCGSTESGGPEVSASWVEEDGVGRVRIDLPEDGGTVNCEISYSE